MPANCCAQLLRRLRYYSVKHGDETGESGADAVLLHMYAGQPQSYRLVNSGVMLAAQADGASIITVEAMSGPAQRRPAPAAGAICRVRRDPVRLLYAGPIAGRQAICWTATPKPSEAEVREAIAGVLCRCTGYLKPVQAILRAAAQLRGEELPPLDVRFSMPGCRRVAHGRDRRR